MAWYGGQAAQVAATQGGDILHTVISYYSYHATVMTQIIPVIPICLMSPSCFSARSSATALRKTRSPSPQTAPVSTAIERRLSFSPSELDKKDPLSYNGETQTRIGDADVISLKELEQDEDIRLGNLTLEEGKVAYCFLEFVVF